MNDYLEYLNESPTVFFKCTTEHGWPVEFVTKNVSTLLGYNSKEFISKNMNFLDIVYENDKQQVIDELTHIPLKKRKYEFKPYRIMTAKGKILWVQDITKIVKDKEGNIVYYFCYLTDITKQMKKDLALNISEDIISTIYNNSLQFIGLLNPDGTLIRANKTSLEFANIKEEEVIGKKFWDCPWWNHSKIEQDILQEDIKKAAKGHVIRAKKVHYDDMGEKIYIDFSIKPVFNRKQEVIYLIPEGHDITQNVRQEMQIKRYFKIIDENVLVSSTDDEGKIISCSKKFEELCEFSKEELLQHRHNIMKHPDNDDNVFKQLWETITKGQKWTGEHRNITKSGEPFFVQNVITPNINEEGEIESYTSIYNDITLQKEISELLITDVLTNIYNRRHFNTIFEQELQRSRRHQYNFVLMMIDIDYFKQYNDFYGHHDGDNTLILVANAIKESLHRPEDYVFRLGGEEFAVITTDLSQQGLIYLANSIRNNVQKLQIEHQCNEVCPYLTVSIGVKDVKSHSKLDYQSIYKQADDALYEAKNKGRNTVEHCE